MFDVDGCTRCGHYDCDGIVRVRVDPYLLEIEDIEVEQELCNGEFEDRCLEI